MVGAAAFPCGPGVLTCLVPSPSLCLAHLPDPIGTEFIIPGFSNFKGLIHSFNKCLSNLHIRSWPLGGPRGNETNMSLSLARWHYRALIPSIIILNPRRKHLPPTPSSQAAPQMASWHSPLTLPPSYKLACRSPLAISAKEKSSSLFLLPMVEKLSGTPVLGYRSHFSTGLPGGSLLDTALRGSSGQQNEGPLSEWPLADNISPLLVKINPSQVKTVLDVTVLPAGACQSAKDFLSTLYFPFHHSTHIFRPKVSNKSIMINCQRESPPQLLAFRGRSRLAWWFR